MWEFAWQNLITRPSRTTLAVVGLTIPVLAFLGLFSISRGIRDLMGNTLSKIQALQVLRENSPSPVFSDLPAAMGPALRKLSGVRVAAPEVWKIAPPINGKGGAGAAMLGLLTRPREQGIKSLTDIIVVEGEDIAEHQKLKAAVFPRAMLPKDQGGGRFLNLGDVGQRNIVISTKIAREYPNPDRSPKKVGQTLRIGSDEFTIVGIYETGSVLLDVTILMDIGVARKLLGLSEGTVSTYAVEPANIVETNAVAERIMDTFPGVRAQQVSQFNLTVGSIMGKLDLFLFLAVALAMLVGAGIANTMLMSTMERYVEFGVMRTNGWTRRNILTLVTSESALLGLLSGVLGSVLATAIVVVVNRFLSGFELNLNPWLIVTSLAAALTIATLSGLYPAWRASRMTPMDAIRQSGTT